LGNGRKKNARWLVWVMVLCFGVLYCTVSALAGLVKTFQQTTIASIVEDPGSYDRKLVALHGKIVRMQGIRSFRGDVFVDLTLVEEKQEELLSTLTVLFWPSKEMSVGDIVTVKGEYHVKWKFGGFKRSNFLAGTIVHRKGEVYRSPYDSL